MISCPNKNTKEWKELERMYGDYAYLIWNEHSGNVPLSEYSGPAFNKHQSILDKLSRIVDINSSGNVFTNGEVLKDNVLEQIKNIVVRENSLYRKNYRFFRTKSGNYILMDGNQFVYYNKSDSEFISNNAAIAILDQFKNKLGVDYEIITPEKASSILKDSPEPYTDETGFYYKNKVYLVDNGEGIDFDSTIHEFAHPFVRAISIHNPSLFASIMNQIIDTQEGRGILKEVVELGYKDHMINEEVAVRAITKLAKKNFDPSTGKLFQEAVKKLLRYLATLMRNIFGKQDLKISEIDPNFTLEQIADIFSLKPGTITLNSENVIQASMKAVNILSKPNAKTIFDKGLKNNWSLDKILTELAIPKEQKQLILDSKKTTLEEIIADLLANYSYTVEINTAKTKMSEGVNDDFVYYKGYRWYSNEDGFFKTDGYSGMKKITEKEYLEAYNSKQETPTQHYLNLTVPGGTNYTENEIATPLITPSIKGHAQFSTDKGIGWFRSDVQLEKANTPSDRLSPYANDLKPSNTRRILELQSDLFQKGRDKKDLISPEGRGQIPIKQLEELNNGTLPKFLSEYTDFNGLLSEKIQVFPHNNKLSFWQNKEYDDKIGSIVSGESQNEHGVKFWTLKDEIAQPLINKYKKSLEDEIEKNRPKPTKENDFLQLLNKNNNWVTFFVKSIIQDSAKKGYEKVLFPTGNTASKIEGHTTLEEFKKEKEDRIKELENQKVNLKNKIQEEYINAQKDNISKALYFEEYGNKTVEERFNNEKSGIESEIIILKQELERVETEGFGALIPIYNFYENTVQNIIKKNFDYKRIVDEYGNDWFEIEVPSSMKDVSVAFNKKSVSEKKESRSQKEIYDSLNPEGKISKSDAGYVVLGETGYKRVTEIVRSKFNLGNLEKSIAQELGDLFHAHASNLIAAAFPEFNTHYKLIKIEGVPQEMLININNIIQPIIDKAKKDGSVLVTELPIANTKTKIAGTVDLLEITKEGKVIMLDYKTSMNKGTTVGKYKKLAGNSKQQALYKEILSQDDERLGRKSIDVGYQSLMNIISYVSRAGKIGYKVQETVPVLYQNTLNKKRDEMLSILYDQIENLVGKINKENREKINKLVEAKRELMVKIQKNVKDSDIIQTAAADVAAIEAYLSNNDDIENYVEFRGDLELYRNLSDYVEVSLSKDKDTIDMIQGKSARLLLDLYNKSENKLSKNIAADLSFDGSPIQSTDDVMKPVQDINLYKAMAFGASYTNNPIVYGIYQKVMEKLGVVRKKSLELANKIKETVSELETFMGSVGESIYEPLLQYKDGEKTGYVVDKYVPEYWNLRRKARQESDIQWFEDNALYDEDAYKKALKNQTDYINSTKNARIAAKIQYLKNKPEYAKNAKENAKKFVEQEIKNELEKWAKNNNNIVQFNKPKDKWIDPKWKDIKEGKYKGTPVEKFYDLYINTMTNLEDSALLPFDFRGNFIADFKKSFLDRVINNGIGNMKLGRSLVDSLSIPYDEAEVNKINPFTGEFIRRIPIVGKKILSSEERKIFNKTEKSFDLGNSLVVFFESAVRYKELTEIEKYIEVARDMLQKQKEEITNVKGENVKGGFNLIKVSKGLDNTISQFNYFVDSTIYGKSVGKETGTEIEGNGITQALGLLEKGDKTTLSWTKVLDSLLKYTGLNNLGYNLYAPVTNLLGGKSMQLLMGVGGRWYSAKDYNFASIVVSAGPFSKASEDIEKANLFVEMINPQVNEFVKDKFEDLKSENKLLKKIPGPFSAMQWSEDHLHKAGLIAMIKSNKHSIKWDEWTVENGKLVYKGKDKIEDFTVERFRQKVLHVTGRAIGNMNPDDKIMLKKWFMGRAVIQHRGWIPAMLSSHWSERQYDYALGEYVEGRFNSFLRFVTTKKLNWKSLDEVEKANVKEAVAEFGIIIGAYMLYAVLKSAGEDDEETKKRLAYFLRISDRYLAEMTFFTPFEISGKHQILISPAPTISTLESWGRLISDLTTYMVVEEKEKEKIDKRLGKRFARVVPSLSQPVRFIDEVIFNQTEEHK